MRRTQRVLRFCLNRGSGSPSPTEKEISRRRIPLWSTCGRPGGRYTPANPILRRRLSPGTGRPAGSGGQIRENGGQIRGFFAFSRRRKWDANRRFWMTDRVPDGLWCGKLKRTPLLRGRSYVGEGDFSVGDCAGIPHVFPHRLSLGYFRIARDLLHPDWVLPIRAPNGPRLAFQEVSTVNYVQKRANYVHGFPELNGNIGSRANWARRSGISVQ